MWLKEPEDSAKWSGKDAHYAQDRHQSKSVINMADQFDDIGYTAAKANQGQNCVNQHD